MASPYYDAQKLEDGVHRESNNNKMASIDRLDEADASPLSRVNTTITLSSEQFEKLYLNPMMRGQQPFTKKLANPTPLCVFCQIQKCVLSRTYRAADSLRVN
jgi:hypothetical protein